MIIGRYQQDIDQAFTNRLAQVLYDLYADNTMTVVVGRDARKQNFELEKTLAGALKALGANVFLLGITSSAAVSFATQAYKATFGVYISAGTKQKQFVGFKIFNGNGFKISDEQLSKVVYQFDKLLPLAPKQQVGKVFLKPYFNNEFASYIKQFSAIPYHQSIKVLADLSCGAAQEIYEELCAHLGIVAFLAAGGIDCDNINLSYQNALKTKKQNFVQISFDKNIEKKNFFDFKFVFSGDGDKLVLFDKKGKKIASDLLFALFALADGGPVVTNLFTNNAVFEFLEQNNIQFITANYGEKSIVNTMLANNCTFGGDAFGNVVFLPHGKTSCAFLTFVKFLSLWCANSALVEQILKIQLVPSKEKFFQTNQNFNMQKWQNFLADCQEFVGDGGKILSRQDRLEGWVSLFVETKDKAIMQSVFELAKQFFKQ